MNRPGSLQVGIQRLKRATHDLQQQWVLTREQWDDQAAREFEARHLEPMMPTLRLIMAETSELEAAYRNMIDECRDQQRDESMF